MVPASCLKTSTALTAPALAVDWASSSSGAQSAWISSTAANDSAPNSVFSPDPGSVGVNELDSPTITLPTGSAQLSFRHKYDLEAGYDGGVLEIKIGSGAWTDILTAGGTFVSGGYGSTLSSSWNNPLGGRQAWSGTTTGFITTLVNLPSAASGQAIQLRWRCGSDSGVSGTGWYVDTVSIATGGYVCCTPSGNLAVFASISLSAGSGVTITFPSQIGANYLLEYKNRLEDPTWTSLPPAVPGTGSMMMLQDTGIPAGSRYYRLRRQ